MGVPPTETTRSAKPQRSAVFRRQPGHRHTRPRRAHVEAKRTQFQLGARAGRHARRRQHIVARGSVESRDFQPVAAAKVGRAGLTVDFGRVRKARVPGHPVERLADACRRGTQLEIEPLGCQLRPRRRQSRLLFRRNDPQDGNQVGVGAEQTIGRDGLFDASGGQRGCPQVRPPGNGIESGGGRSAQADDVGSVGIDCPPLPRLLDCTSDLLDGRSPAAALLPRRTPIPAARPPPPKAPAWARPAPPEEPVPRPTPPPLTRTGTGPR